MSDHHDELELTLDESEMIDLAKSEAEDVPVVIEPTGSTSNKHPHRPAAQSLVRKKKPVKCSLSKEPTIRLLQAQVEELQQKALTMAAV